MKHLKLKSIAFSFLAVIALSIFMIACDQESVSTPNLSESIDQMEDTYFILSEELDGLSEVELYEYFENLTSTDELEGFYPEDIQSRWCTSPKLDLVLGCQFDNSCSGGTLRERYMERWKYYCDGSGWKYFYKRKFCCS